MEQLTLAAVLKRMMERDDITVHGFRSPFRDWAGGSTKREVIEAPWRTG